MYLDFALLMKMVLFHKSENVRTRLKMPAGSTIGQIILR